MIHLDSPVVTVLGEQRGKKATERLQSLENRLGIRTVGDLLHHFPRRYVKTGELSDVDALHEGDVLTVVGQIGRAHV